MSAYVGKTARCNCGAPDGPVRSRYSRTVTKGGMKFSGGFFQTRPPWPTSGFFQKDGKAPEGGQKQAVPEKPTILPLVWAVSLQRRTWLVTMETPQTASDT